MEATAAASAMAGKIGSEQSYDDEGVDGVDALQIEKRYGEERSKRLRDEGIDQFVDISLTEKFRHFQEDPWIDYASIKDLQTQFPEKRTQVLIIGGGFGGLMYAVRMVEAGVRPEDLRIIDIAGGFGGTWYYNRYPGLMCDIESHCYLPLLEETGYMPKHRYSYGQEIRNYAELVAEKYNIANSAVFSTQAEGLKWSEAAKEWQVDLVQQRKDQPPQKLSIRSTFVATVNGVLNWPKLPGLPGILDYQGKTFHSSRWNYSLTGGSQEDPSLTQLKDKRVAIIGTGASSVQIIPHLAKWSKHLYVVQRTPSAVDVRDQRETDPEWFKKEVANSKGWQRERLRNFHQHFTTGELPKINMVDDQWTHAKGMVAIAGNKLGPQTPADLPAYMKKMNSLDLPRQTAVRRRVDSLVDDHDTAEKLKAWYPTWCKRPTFHDEYLQTFNQANVTLIDSNGKGLDSLTTDSIIANGTSYPVDIVIFATGFRPPYGGTPAEKANLKIHGRNGVSMSDQWAQHGPSTLHGVLDANFPNLFLSGPWQASTSPNFLFGVDCLAKHAAYILSEARRRADGAKFEVAPTEAAAQDWGMQVLMRSAPMAAILGCTPSYFNLEGMLDKVPQEAQEQVARSGLWGHGIEDFLEVIGAWEDEGTMRGIEVRT